MYHYILYALTDLVCYLGHDVTYVYYYYHMPDNQWLFQKYSVILLSP